MNVREVWKILKAGGQVRDRDGDVWAIDEEGLRYLTLRYGAKGLREPWRGLPPKDAAPYELIPGTSPKLPPLPEPTPPLKDTNPKTRHGATKPSLALIPSTALQHTALAFENGASKYGAYNWREHAVSSMTYLNAALRHIHDVIDGVDVAADSGVDNLGHAIASLAILIDARECGKLVDDRPKPGQSEALSLRLQAWKKERASAKT